jgi:hypothetical protein
MATEIPQIHDKLIALLSPQEFRSSAEIIDHFAIAHPDHWEHLVNKYGDRQQQPGEGGRRHYFAASTYIADRLSDLVRMGRVELKHTTDFDRSRWIHNKRMGIWRLKSKDPVLPLVSEEAHLFTVKLPKSQYAKLVMIADRRGITVASTAADLLAGAISICV